MRLRLALPAFLLAGLAPDPAPAAAARPDDAPSFHDNFRKVCDAPRRFTDLLRRVRLTEDLAAAARELPRTAGTLGLDLDARRAPEELRIGANRVDPDSPATWKHFASDDGRSWVDLVEYDSEEAAQALMEKKGQAHSGTWGADAATFITLWCDEGAEAVAGIVRRGRYVFNVGRALPFAVVPPSEGENSAEQRAEVDRSIDVATGLLEAVTRAVVHPDVVTWIPSARPGEAELRALRVASFARLWSEVKYNFVFLDQRPDLDWERVLELYLPRVMAAESDAEYVAVLEECVALLRDGHTSVSPSGSARIPRDAPPLALEPVEGRPVVTHVAATPGLERAGIRPGLELIEVDGEPVGELLGAIYPRVFASTPQDRDRRAFARLLEGEPGSTARATFRDPAGKKKTVRLARDGEHHRELMGWRRRPPVVFRRLDDGIAYVALNTFGTDAVVEGFDEHFDAILKSKALILDVRHNGGGSSSRGYRILARLLTEATDQTSRWRTRTYKPTFRAWGRDEEWHEGEHGSIRPRGKYSFGGPVAVLIGPATYSAAEDFLVPVKATGRATLVGQPTGGSTGQPLSVSLHAAHARIVTKWDHFPDGTDFVGIGIQPDVAVAPTREDVAEGRDPVLERAVELLRSEIPQ